MRKNIKYLDENMENLPNKKLFSQKTPTQFLWRFEFCVEIVSSKMAKTHLFWNKIQLEILQKVVAF